MKYRSKLFFLLGSLFLVSKGVANPVFYFPQHQVSLAYYNHNLIKGSLPALPKPLFWSSQFQAEEGGMARYLKNVYHTQKYLSLFFGLSFSNWSASSSTLYAVSGIFELRWWIWRSPFFNPYFMYSIAGPTALSNNRFSGSKLGSYVLFQDYLGIGIMLGEKQHFNIEATLVHYSNGDLGVYNQGMQVPFLIALGYSF